MIKPIENDPIAKLVGLSIVSSIVLLWGSAALAQRPIADDTLGNENSVVVPDVFDGTLGHRIRGGAQRGTNLFHSFQEFNIDEGRAAYFENPAGVENILSRVTGNSRSEILGRLGVLGNANLFLLNPSGIIFGPNASLDIRGSFAATTANAIQFDDQGFFSAADADAPLLLTVDPSAFLFDQLTPGQIENRSVASSGRGLQVGDGQSLLLLGGKIDILGGRLHAVGGRVELAGVASSGIVELNVDGSNLSLSIPDSVVRADVSLTDGAEINVLAPAGDGSITVIARNLNIQERSRIGSRHSDFQTVDITLNATGAVTVEQDSRIANVGNGGILIQVSGDINIIDSPISSISATREDTGTISMIAGGNISISDSPISTNNVRGGRSGNIVMQAGGGVSIVGTDIETSAIGGEGTSGSVSIFTNEDIFFEDSFISTRTNSNGISGNISVRADGNINFVNSDISNSTIRNEGDAGNILVQADGNIDFVDSGIFSGTNNEGDAGNISVRADGNINFVNSEISTTTLSQSRILGGDAGNILIQARGNINFVDNFLSTSTFSRGEAGRISVQADGNINFSGDLVISGSGSRSRVVPNAEGGDGGDVYIRARSLSVSDGADISALTTASGNAGSIWVEATDFVTFSDSELSTQTEGIGDAGGITIDTPQLLLQEGAQISASTSNRGQGGSITVTAPAEVILSGNSELSVETSEAGRAGDVTITTENLTVAEQASITATATATATASERGGSVTLNASNMNLFGTVGVLAETQGAVPAGLLTLQPANHEPNLNVNLAEGSRISASTSGSGQGGDLIIRAPEAIAIRGDGRLSVETDGPGNAGNLSIATQQLTLEDGVEISASTTSRQQGEGGRLQINATSSVLLNNQASLLTESSGSGTAGNLTIETPRLTLTEGSEISASSQSRQGGDIVLRGLGALQVDNSAISASTVSGRAGSLTVDAPGGSVQLYGTLNNGESAGLAVEGGSSGRAGSLSITADQLTVDAGAAASVSSGGRAGNLTITANSIRLDQGRLTAETREGSGANIQLQDLDLLLMRNGSEISAQAFRDADGGNMRIDASDGFIVAVPSENSDIIANAVSGDGGRIDITTQGLFGIEPQASPTDRSDITASSNFGLQGTIAINTPDIDPSRGLTELPDAPVDASNQIAQTCPTGGNITEALGEFVVTGRGGLPANSTEILSGDVVLPRLSGLPNERTEERVGRTNPEVPQIDTVNPPPPSLVEAQGWKIDTEGNVALIAATPSQSSAFAEVQCHSSN